MGKHEFLDTLVAGMGSMYGNSLKFFSEGTQSASLEELVAQSSATAPEWDGKGEYVAEVRTPLGAIPTKFTVLEWVDASAPVLIFHHGSGDIPYHTRARKILGADKAGFAPPFESDVNIIATNSPFNESHKEYYAAIRDLERFGVLIAGSVALIEALVRAVPEARKTVVSGISLGGWITNLHHACYDSADEYRPIFAGAALDRLFLDSAYRKLTGKHALETSVRLTDCLNFEAAFARRSNENVHALLGRFDRYIVLEQQASIYRDDRLTVIDRGHITGSGDNETLRGFVGEAFEGLRGREPARTSQRAGQSLGLQSGN